MQDNPHSAETIIEYLKELLNNDLPFEFTTLLYMRKIGLIVIEEYIQKLKNAAEVGEGEKRSL